MTTISDSPSAEQLRADLADSLVSKNSVRTPAIAEAFRAVPRHCFVPNVPLTQAYADDAVYTKYAPDGARISAASQPSTVAMMLEQLAPQPGEKILEAGAGTGYNAALIGHLVGPAGRVHTIDVDDDLVTGARQHLAAAGIDNVEVILGDGALGHPEAAPYHHAIATVSAWEVPDPWLTQLAPGARLVVPLRLRGTASRSIVFKRGSSGWVGTDSQLAVFMPLRGIGDDARRMITLAPGVELQVHKDQQVNGEALTGVLDTPRHEVWTGVLFPAMESFEWMDLWLCMRLPTPLMRMNTEPHAKESGLVAPMFGWGAMATTSSTSLAYFTLRPATLGADGRKRWEVGLIAHGPANQRLAEEVAQETVRWNADFRDHPVTIAMPDITPAPDPDNGVFVLDRPHRLITVIWDRP
ncbi:methyltransferase, FxLD system [Nonomuraea endophytica]|uniref:methyltransferase, FxLD system n=1 Tax=Nonomuraea endophytica TaxID=714136 RepID=UPI0037C90726